MNYRKITNSKREHFSQCPKCLEQIDTEVFDSEIDLDNGVYQDYWICGACECQWRETFTLTHTNSEISQSIEKIEKIS